MVRSSQLVSAFQSAPTPARFYLPELDSLRFFAFFSVFLSHTLRPGLIAASAGRGVDLFFCLSAFLLTELMLREKEQTGELDIKAFYVRRALRIWPLYFGFLLAVFIVWCTVGIPSIPGKLFVVYAFCLGDFPALAWPKCLAVGPLWSISLEEQIYFLWPHCVRRLSRYSMATAGAAFWVAVVAIRMAIFDSGRGTLFLPMLMHLDSVACGIVIAGALRPSTALPRGLVCLGVVTWMFGSIYVMTPIHMNLAFVSVGVGSGAFLLSVIKVEWLRNPVTVYLGRISYGLYIFHGAALLLTHNPLVALGVTVAIAAASYRWFESPFLRLKSRFQRV
jgi:peptidoglycan/LPS O-acetylase OafA/YrhL